MCVLLKRYYFFNYFLKEYSSVDSLTLKKAHSGLTGFILEGGKRKADPILMRFVFFFYFLNEEKTK